MSRIAILAVLSGIMIVLLHSCDEGEDETRTPALRICDQQLADICPNSTEGEYCLLGLKWGDDSGFITTGANGVGPQSGGGEISYSFQTEIKQIRMHNNDNLQTISIDDKGACVREQIKTALMNYENVADLLFKELDDDIDADIEFYASTNETLNVGYCNFPSAPCEELKGRVIFSKQNVDDRCDDFFQLALHEIGHALGLGHVNSENIMNVDVSNFTFDTLQDGDIKGIRSIYG